MNVRLFCICLALVAAGCRPFVGQLTVTEPTPIYVTKIQDVGTPGCQRGADGDCPSPIVRVERDSLPPGTYRAELSYQENDKLRLRLGDSVVDIGIPPGTVLPADDGHFRLAGTEAGQLFDVLGDIDTQVELSERVAGWESCEQVVPKLVCHHGNHQGCYHYYVTVYGERPVSFRWRHQTKRIDLRLQAPGDPVELATFSGQQTQTGKAYDYIGACGFGYGYGYGYSPYFGHHHH